MDTCRPLLVAIGDTEDHLAALTYAAHRALAEERDLHLVHVVHPPHGLAGPQSMLVSFDHAELAGGQLVHGAAEQITDLTSGAVSVTTSTPHGGVVDVLTDLAAHSAGVILQHRHRGHLAAALGGSVATGVAGRSAVPVTSVPEGWQPGDPNGTRPTQVTVAVGDRRSVDYLMQYALHVAATRNAALSIVHAWDIPAAYARTLVSSDKAREWSKRERAELDDLVAPWVSKYPDVDVEVRVTRGNTVRVVLDAFEPSTLLLVGRHRGHLHLRRLGSVTRALLGEAPGPLEVVPPDGTDRETPAEAPSA